MRTSRQTHKTASKPRQSRAQNGSKNQLKATSSLQSIEKSKIRTTPNPGSDGEFSREVQINSIRDVGYRTIKSTLKQSHILRHKIFPLRYMEDRDMKQLDFHSSRWIKPLDSVRVGLLHSLPGTKDLTDHIKESNIPNSLALAGAQVDVLNLNWISSQAVKASLASVEKAHPALFDKNDTSLSAAKKKQEIQSILEPLVINKIQKKYPEISPAVSAMESQLKSHYSRPFDVLLTYSTSRRAPDISCQEYVYKASIPAIAATTTAAASDKDKIRQEQEQTQLNGAYKSFDQLHTINVTSPTTSLVPLLTIFSLMPQYELFHTPNKLKVAFVGYDYSNKGFVQELIYLCHRMGVNLAISTPTQPSIAPNVIDSQFIDDEIDYFKQLTSKKLSNDLTEAEETLLKNVMNVNHFDYNPVIAQAGKMKSNEQTSPTMKKKKDRSNSNKDDGHDDDDAHSQGLSHHGSASIEYIKHPYLAVSLADVVVTNSILPATQKYTESRGYEVDKEMLTFAKDTAKLYHVTEGIHSWKEPPLGVHDPRCMMEQQAIAENYVLTSLLMTVLNKNTM